MGSKNQSFNKRLSSTMQQSLENLKKTENNNKIQG